MAAQSAAGGASVPAHARAAGGPGGAVPARAAHSPGHQRGPSMTRRGLVVAYIAMAVQQLAIQVIAVLTLAPHDYGAFGLVYLAFAWMLSLSLSIVSEPWARGDDADRAPWAAYCGALLALVVSGAAVLAAVLAVIGAPWAMWALGAAAVLAAYRAGARYVAAAEHDGRHLTAPDLTATAVTVASWALATTALQPLEAVAAAWLAGNLAGILLSQRVPWRRLRLRGWLARHGADVRVLLTESLLLDAGSIAVPALLAGPLGLGGYGVYRAAQSMTSPSLLLLGPLRPLMTRWGIDPLVGARAFALSVGAGAAVAGAVVGALLVIDALGLMPGSVLHALLPHLAPVALLVASALPAHFYYLAARIHLPGRALLRTRVASLALAAAGPLGGAAIGGLSAALWGFALAIALAAAILLLELSLHARRTRASR
ncbi:hypothetical protein [Agrococcus carbonis]|uniref:Membrane protein involved in the export of O-antigen and teichoic acid n=1 Tax=Agrococcus carbonis TaxID=684552 RepID=A0A1H1RFX6_9MICO|nr:hypothetical protein [Agrococcus carbonis]SDS34654.1 hypothetical protein SAMN04489719_2109 [Agrococcus carbonis]